MATTALIQVLTAGAAACDGLLLGAVVGTAAAIAAAPRLASGEPRTGARLLSGDAGRITILYDTSATHCFICAHLAAAHNLAPSGQQGPGSVTTAATGGTRDSDLAASMQIFLSLGDVLRE